MTGTNGKTTTATLLTKMMKKTGKPVLLGGNIGKALSEEADHLPKEGFVVLEVSSYQLETTVDFRPHIGGVLNFTPDHLDRHKTMENYQNLKAISESGSESEWSYFRYHRKRGAL